MVKKLIVYGIAVILMVVSFFLPPTGQIDPTVLMAASIIIGGYEWLFGSNIKSIEITKEGLKFEKEVKQ